MKICLTLDIRRTKSLIQQIDNQILTLVCAMGNMTSWYLSTTCISAFDICMHKSHPWYLFPNRINILQHVLFFLSVNKTYYICCKHTLIHVISFHSVIICMYDGCSSCITSSLFIVRNKWIIFWNWQNKRIRDTRISKYISIIIFVSHLPQENEVWVFFFSKSPVDFRAKYFLL